MMKTKRISIIIFLILHNVIHQVYVPLHFGIAKENHQGPKLGYGGLCT